MALKMADKLIYTGYRQKKVEQRVATLFLNIGRGIYRSI